MRKKLLSLLTVLCLVLGMLPTTAFAAAAEAYEKNEVARVITTDTEIAEDIDGLVLVDAPCKVTVKDAKLSVGIVVSPDAAGAEVILTGTTEAAEVVVLSASSVKVEETATATSVTVDAAEATVEVAGTAAEVIVTENAEKTAVTVAETAKVETVSVAAPAAAVEVVGEVKTVAVAETAAAATVTVAETATVSALEVAAPDVKADVAGTVESVTVAETATGAELVVAETATITEVTDATGELTVSGDGADKVTVNDTTASEEEEEDEEEDLTGPVDLPWQVETPTYTGPRITWAPMVDHAGETETEIENVQIGEPVVTPTGDNRASVTLNAQDLPKHTGTNGKGPAYWIGFGIQKEEGTTYKYYVLQKNDDGTVPADGTWVTPTVPSFSVENVGTFDSLYFSVDFTPVLPADPTAEVDNEGDEDEDASGAGGEGDEGSEPVASVPADKETEYVVVVTKVPAGSAQAEGDKTIVTPDDLPDITKDTVVEGEEIVYIYDVSINATVVPPESEG